MNTHTCIPTLHYHPDTFDFSTMHEKRRIVFYMSSARLKTVTRLPSSKHQTNGGTVNSQALGHLSPCDNDLLTIPLKT